MPLRLHVTMLGRFELWTEMSDGGDEARRSLPLPVTSKSQSLLAYLLLHRNVRHSREALAEMFWPERPTSRARRSLSTALWRIRCSFAPLKPLQGDHRTVWIELGEGVDMEMDVEQFRTLARRQDIASLQQAIHLYQGEFLPGFYDDWVVQERDWLQAIYQDVLLRLMSSYEARGENQSALTCAQQVLQIDPYCEPAHRAAMRAYAGLGKLAAVLTQYERCRQSLVCELGMEPSVQTVAQVRALLAADAAPVATARCTGESLLGLAARWRGDWEEAIHHYQNAARHARAIPDYMSLVESLAGAARCQLRLGCWEETEALLNSAREIVRTHDVKGDVLSYLAVAALETALWMAQRHDDARTTWLKRAKEEMREARKQARAFRSAEPEVWRLCGRYEWLRGRPASAQAWWRKSLARAEALGHRMDWGMTALEMGLRLGDDALRDAGREWLEEMGALGEIAFLEE